MPQVFNLRTLTMTLALFPTSAASAVPLLYNMSGSVDSVDAALSGYFQVGTPFSMNLVIDSTASPTLTSPWRAVYLAHSAEARLGGFDMSPVSFSGWDIPEVAVVNDSITGHDDFQFYTYPYRLVPIGPGEYVLDEFYVRLGDSNGSAFDSTALPLAVDRSDFTSANFTLQFIEFSGFPEWPRVEGAITSFTVTAVPEPQSCVLLGTALLGLIFWIPRHQRCVGYVRSLPARTSWERRSALAY